MSEELDLIEGSIHGRIGNAGIGDVTSNERGTGARFNAGKVPYELIAWSEFAKVLLPATPSQMNVRYALMNLGEFQAGGTSESLHNVLIYSAMAAELPLLHAAAETAKVLDYGRVKYAAFNWAKGMPWQSVIGCAARHLMGTPGNPGMWDDPKGTDHDSGLMHVGHVGCNVMFLLTFMLTYREGDDRPKALVPQPF